MSRTLAVCTRRTLCLLCGAMLLGFAVRAHADPKPLTKEEQAKVDKAIEKGVAFLKRAQTEKGDWKWLMYRDGRYAVGQCALPAYALLEAGVSTDDPVIQKAADYLRPRVLANDQTYELALAILFFDRLGNPKDKPLIRSLALRLIAGQHYTGGWSYLCPILNEKNEDDLLAALEQLNKRMEKGKKTRHQSLEQLEVPQSLKLLTAFQRSRSLPWRETTTEENAANPSLRRNQLVHETDNSNTQFAMLGLWAAQRHGIPVNASFEVMVERFERSQLFPSGIWLYRIANAEHIEERQSKQQLDLQYKRSMTCVGLMGLAIGRGLSLPTSGFSVRAGKDIHVLRGLAALRSAIGKPLGRMNERVRPLPDLYFVWSLERVGMLYNLSTIGGRDWYRWGAEALVTNQAATGGWPPSPLGMDYKATMNTAFALLFLKRSHPMKDLTPKLPFTAKELNEGVAHLKPDDKFPAQAFPSPSQNTNPKRTRNRDP